MAIAFIADDKVWNDFAFASHQATSDFEPAERSYDELITGISQEVSRPS